MNRREYNIDPIIINRLTICKVVIDPHYEEKHADRIDDTLILSLVRKLDGRFEIPEDTDGEFSYFATLLSLQGKQYRLVWLLDNKVIYIGIINTYRDKREV